MIMSMKNSTRMGFISDNIHNDDNEFTNDDIDDEVHIVRKSPG